MVYINYFIKTHTFNVFRNARVVGRIKVQIIVGKLLGT